MTIITGLIIRFYAALIHLYPDQFRLEFEIDMQATFAEALAEALEQRGLSLFALCWREIWDWPQALLSAHWLNLKDRLKTAAREKIRGSYDTPGILPLPEGSLKALALVMIGKHIIIKRLLELIFATFWLTVTAPLLLIIAILVKLDSPGSILFRQERVGQNGRVFTMYKFRSMVCSAKKAKGQVNTTKLSPRVTRVGRFIRQMKLDELPQLVNIVKGDMGLLGSRPKRAIDDSL